ncbi:hypothetical protein POVWA2_036180 [Plasmodium ovale wallikeri]|uniref:Uncharacterized protein n=1 Tax=Plasmodium ovale wallikeri TaxID=864142 RepID=A0A1A8Z233_PLAOA|nr:hypothetical protein POVWA1_036870 [Plasmodium ovale wallikeri]SBT38628.1 hypothetical protein POVWA2_036180 [Plasmodium ovale wallikeri]
MRTSVWGITSGVKEFDRKNESKNKFVKTHHDATTGWDKNRWGEEPSNFTVTRLRNQNDAAVRRKKGRKREESKRTKRKSVIRRRRKTYRN